EVRRFIGHASDVNSVTFSPDGKYALSGSWDKTMRLWDLSTGKNLKTFTGHTGAVGSVAFSPDEKSAFSGSYDATTRVWDITTGKELVQFIGFAGGEWVAITPEGYYNASPNGDRHLNVQVGGKVYGIDNYRETFFRPDLVKLALSGGSLRDYRTLADVKQPPKVSIVQTPDATTAEAFKVNLRLEEQGGGIGDVRLFLNGSAVLLDNDRGMKVVAKSEKGVTYRNYTLKLSPGGNTIRAVAFNADNSMQSNDATHQVAAGFTATRKPVMHALVIGIQEFKNPKLQLKYAVADARLMEEALRKTGAGLYERVAVTLLVTPQETTGDAIKKALERYRSINPDDLFVFFVASHGTVDEGEYFLLTSNVGSTSTEKLKRDALSQRDLKERIANIPATKKLIVIDTCNAAALSDAIQVAMLTRGMSEDTAMKVLSRAVGSTIISASTSVQEALEGYRGHGLLTWVMVEGLQGKADADKDGFIKTTELANYVDDEVPKIAEQHFRKAQYPTVSPSGQAFPIGRVK
ncbi:MAG: caspase family protein, partial [Syntrophales bacterium]|nr:caspase family protein [Syntrophales bacterium]